MVYGYSSPNNGRHDTCPIIPFFYENIARDVTGDVITICGAIW